VVVVVSVGESGFRDDESGCRDDFLSGVATDRHAATSHIRTTPKSAVCVGFVASSVLAHSYLPIFPLAE
jgi:hypothetical protein